jgi:signal transduction histidine kinase
MYRSTSGIIKPGVFLLLFFLVAARQPGFTQQLDREIDSLRNVLKTTGEDTNKVNVLNLISRKLVEATQNENPKDYAELALSLAKNLNFKPGIAFAYYNIGLFEGQRGRYTEAFSNFRKASGFYAAIGDEGGLAAVAVISGFLHYRLRDYSEALKCYGAALSTFQKIKSIPGMSDVHRKLGVLYADQGDYSEALKYYIEALKLAESTNDKGPISECYVDIGYICEHQRKYGEALKYFLSALKLRQEIGWKPAIAGAYNDLAIAYLKQSNYSEALKNGRLALKINEEIQDKWGIAFSYRNLAEVYRDHGDYSEAVKSSLTSLRIYADIGDKWGMAINYNDIGRVYTKLHRYSEARQYLVNCLSISKEIGAKEELRDAYFSLSQLDSITGDFHEGLAHFKLYSVYKDSLLNETNGKRIAIIKEQYESEKKDKEIALLNKETAIRDLQLKKQKQAKNYFIAGLGLFFVLGFFIYRNHHNRQKLKLLTLRNKIASDLHDDVGSTLSSISIFSQMAQQQSGETIPLLETIGESSRKMLDAMADIVWTIKPENDQFEKIIMRMRSFAYELLGAKKIDFEFIADDEVSKINLPMEVRKNLYLIFKEATNNMVKYAQANKAMFAIKEEKNNLTMMIRDNGKGFDSSKQTEGNGLRNMKRRASEMGAELVIDSQPGIGTMIQLKVAV